MKTLDEVIFEAPYTLTPWEADSLHYLKAFRDAKNELDAEREKVIETYCQWQDAKEKLEAQTSHTMWVDNHFQFEISDNPPLTWDELKLMGGKPVWIEYAGDEEQTGWALIVKNPERPTFGKPTLFTFVRDEGKFYLTITGYGKRWKAYRKEVLHAAV